MFPLISLSSPEATREQMRKQEIKDSVIWEF
jgi:hypothetical protein